MKSSLPLLLMILLPMVWPSVAIYSKDFSQDCYIYRTEIEEMIPQNPHILASFLRDLGFTVDVIDSTDDLSRYDALIVLSCTTLGPDDVNRILSFYESGKGLILDARKTNLLTDYFGIGRKSYPLEGMDRSSLKTAYVTITNGILINKPITGPMGPIRYGLEKMYYVGKPLYLPSGFNSGFVTESGENVMGWKVDGRKRVAVVGCLFCSDPLLLANLVDWAEDGRIDFPTFYVRRSVIPETASLGNTVVDQITVSFDEGIDRMEGSYLYGVGGRYCNFGEPAAEFSGPQPIGDGYEMTAKFVERATTPGTCYFPPALLRIRAGDSIREIIVDPVEITVSKRGVLYVKNDDILIYAAAGVAILLLILFLATRESKKSKILKEYRKYKELIRVTKARRLKGEISEEAYKDLIKEYEGRLQEIEVEMKLMGIKPSSLGDRGQQQRRGQQ